ncbi:hypothetical protein [Rhodovulum sp. MB263]|uniref:hypothetical protein n=1 Tax=Rhodovulum sp. (strain MB263) TaxID=308754 RepID=UPI0009B76BEA|nr:hypothetical protein [Rhodovulum sp. MB263]ARC87130.1 hypothetical protein B5V46_00020 [Rhodovulum sp. MB263]
MANPRLPADVAAVTGAAAKNPQRHKGRATPMVKGLGDPPAYLGEIEQEAWRMFADEMPWLGASDRAITETASRLRARMMADPNMGVNALAQFRLCLSAMGGTPSDRSKVAAPEEPDDDPADAYFN